jgi:hypothetical protein
MPCRSLLLLAVLSIASAAQASWWPRVETDTVRLAVGEQAVVGVEAVHSGFSNWPPFTPWRFHTDDANVATAEGGKESLSRPGSIRITAIAPGIAHVRLDSTYAYITVTVVGDYPPPHIALSTRVVSPGQPVTLTAIFPYPALYTWHAGALGDRTKALGSTSELTYIAPTRPGTYHVWLNVTTSSFAGMAEATIEVVEPRGRAARH